ncbi:MAG: cytochrome c biogenesis protein CcsA [Prevotella sp.]|nr:cytochrome c biogenesis protein CcsA [Prevotella sp.]
MTWSHFIFFAIVAIVLWATGAVAAWKEKKNVVYVTTIAGLAVFFAFIVGMWISLERPPLRTMGETRLWYSFFLPLAGIIIYSRWHYRWILSFSTLMAVVFIAINLFKPEIHSKTLMPALQSPWFAPHVIVYMFAYALLGASFVMAVYLLGARGKEQGARDYSGDQKPKSEILDKSQASNLKPQISNPLDNLVYVGLAFMTIGMLFGALWAKEAWGHYWAWDPKETWAAITWFAYLVYIHYRLAYPQRLCPALWMLIVAFILLQMCWWGINYLPSTQGTSVHTYNM